jgi:hypothetical protein
MVKALTVLDGRRRTVERGVFVTNNEHGNFGAVFAPIPYLICQKPTSSRETC